MKLITNLLRNLRTLFRSWSIIRDPTSLQTPHSHHIKDSKLIPRELHFKPQESLQRPQESIQRPKESLQRPLEVRWRPLDFLEDPRIYLEDPINFHRTPHNGVLDTRIRVQTNTWAGLRRPYIFDLLLIVGIYLYIQIFQNPL